MLPYLKALTAFAAVLVVGLRDGNGLATLEWLEAILAGLSVWAVPNVTRRRVTP